MTEHDAIKTMETLRVNALYIIEFGSNAELFRGDDATEWFWSCLEAIKMVIEDWNITKRPKQIKIMVRREVEDKGAMPWMLVFEFEPHGFEAPWINLDLFEEQREIMFATGQALVMSWRNRDAKAIADKFKPGGES